MPTFWLLMILWIGSSDALPRATGPEYLKLLSFEFDLNQTIVFSPQLRQLLEHAELYHQNLTMTQSCTHPIEFNFAICNEILFRQGHQETNTTLFFDEHGIMFLKNSLEKSCHGKDNKEIDFRIYSSQETLCTFEFQLINYHPRYLKEFFIVINTPIKHWYYYLQTHAPPPDFKKKLWTSTTFIMTVILMAVVAFCFLSMLISKCLTSDGLGDDEKNIDAEEQEDLKYQKKSEGWKDMKKSASIVGVTGSIDLRFIDEDNKSVISKDVDSYEPHCAFLHQFSSGQAMFPAPKTYVLIGYNQKGEKIFGSQENNSNSFITRL